MYVDKTFGSVKMHFKSYENSQSALEIFNYLDTDIDLKKSNLSIAFNYTITLFSKGFNLNERNNAKPALDKESFI